MPVVNSICLDHFYITLNNEPKECISEIFKDVSGFRDEEVKTTNDEWSGFYLRLCCAWSECP